MGRDRRRWSGRRAGPYRTCIGCRRRLALKASVRLVRDPQGGLLPDLSGKLPGRGAHLCPDLRCFELACERQAFQRSLDASAQPGELGPLVERLVEGGLAQTRALLATAARSGWIEPGRDAVRQAVTAHQAALVLLAEDGSAALRAELGALAERERVPCRQALRVVELAQYHHGRDLAVLAVRHRGLAARLLEELDRTQALSASLHGPRAPVPRELTGNPGGGKMPLTQGGHGPSRPGKGV
ncbi:MAG TPA: DUF448 domain-containing protein [Myxococcota bacterium]|nr:DUF448 domain-containing protein [Myxococcota bacterium]HRY92308.1 DUF448 domain-containing protein [Myxococcota bacterium]